MPLIVVGRTRREAEAAVAPYLDALLANCSDQWRLPLASLADLTGALIVGTAQDIADGVAELGAAGAELVIVDPRLRMDRYEEIVELIGEVLGGR